MDRLKTSQEGKTLVLCPIGLGNFLMATPALKLLSESVGREQLVLLALKPSIAQMAVSSRLFGKVYSWDPDREGLVAGLKALVAMRREKFSHSLALFPTSHWKFSVFQFLIGAKSRRGFSYPHQKIPAWVQHQSIPLAEAHDTFQNLRLVEEFLERKSQPVPVPFFPENPETPFGLPSLPYFACHPGSSVERGMAEKRLPPDQFSALIRNIHQATGWGCVLVGGPEERELCEAVAVGCPEAIVPVVSRSLVETAGILKSARFLLCNDSGMMHLAASLGTPCAAFFGPTDEKRTGPYGFWEKSSSHLILRKPGLECAPCWTVKTVGMNPPCIYGDTRCLRTFAVENIWAKLEAWLFAL